MNVKKYSLVWGISIKTNKEKIKEPRDELWQYAQRVATKEMDDPEAPDFLQERNASKKEQGQ